MKNLSISILLLSLCIPSFTKATNLGEEEIEAFHTLKENLDEALLTENGMYEVPISENDLFVLAGAGVGAAIPAGLTSLRNWQDYLLDMSDGKTLDEKMAYLFKHKDEFGLDIKHLVEGTPHTGDELIGKGGYGIVLRSSSTNDNLLLFIGRNGDTPFINVVNSVYVRPHFRLGEVRLPGTHLNPLHPPPVIPNNPNYRMVHMDRVFLDETIESRRSLIKATTERTEYPHIVSPERYARDARGRIVLKFPRPSLFKRLAQIVRRGGGPGMHILAWGVGLSSLFFASDADAEQSDRTPESILMTPEEFQQTQEDVNSALDTYYSMQ